MTMSYDLKLIFYDKNYWIDHFFIGDIFINDFNHEWVWIGSISIMGLFNSIELVKRFIFDIKKVHDNFIYKIIEIIIRPKNIKKVINESNSHEFISEKSVSDNFIFRATCKLFIHKRKQTISKK